MVTVAVQSAPDQAQMPSLPVCFRASRLVRVGAFSAQFSDKLYEACFGGLVSVGCMGQPPSEAGRVVGSDVLDLADELQKNYAREESVQAQRSYLLPCSRPCVLYQGKDPERTAMRRLTPDDLPTGVSTTAKNLPGNGRIYTFTHAQLGPLGRLRIVPHGSGQILASAEIAPGDPDAPEWEQKFRLLDQVITTCLNALPGGNASRPLADREEMREQRRLFRRLIDAQHSIAMFGLAKDLSEREYQVLVNAIQEALVTASPSDALGLRQRLEELQFYWLDLQARPIV
jgi:hypothetical protein